LKRSKVHITMEVHGKIVIIKYVLDVFNQLPIVYLIVTPIVDPQDVILKVYVKNVKMVIT